MSSQTELFTIGHSNHPIDRFLALLDQHEIKAVADIRRFPSSRKFPHFNQENLDPALEECGIQYHWFEALGGRRHAKKSDKPSPNIGLQNEGFRNYADHMSTDEFQLAVTKLLEIAVRKRTAIMCAESLFWRCHRRLVSDFLLANGVGIEHIFPTGEARAHKLTKGAEVHGSRVIYPLSESELF